ncbi:MAG: XdhC family protein [Acidocella sp.]|uniref:XdhC family protein n=1 Tax=Acidocella sp. TaxID=50710 RepID=UPI003FC5A786
MLNIAYLTFEVQSWDEGHAALRFAAVSDAALCTIVGIEGRFSRRLGAQRAIGPNNKMVGSLADGCLEKELAHHAANAGKLGERPVLRFGRGSRYLDFRLPCGSGIDILVDPQPNRNELARAVAALDTRKPSALSLPVQGPNMLEHRRYLPPCRYSCLAAGRKPMLSFAWLARSGYVSGTFCPAVEFLWDGSRLTFPPTIGPLLLSCFMTMNGSLAPAQ